MSLFKSVFVRYLITFVAIILLSFGILALIMTYLMQGFSEETTRESLEQIAKSTGDLIEHNIERSDAEDLLGYSGGDTDSFSDDISVFSRYANEVYVIVAGVDGKIIAADSGVPDDYIISDLPSEIVEAIINVGETDFREEFDGVFSEKSYVYAEAVKSSGGKTFGIVVASRPVVYTRTIVNDTSKTILMACLWVMMAAIIASYFISERIVRPLYEISNAAKEFAEGHFDVRVTVKGNDEISQLATAFNNMASELEKLEQTRNSFIANVSHDLRSPMTSIAGFVDGMLEGAIPPEKHEHYLGIISNEVHRLARLVSLLLDISRIQAGERKFNMVSFDVCEMARQILISFEKRIDEKHLNVEFECDRDNMYVIADTDAIHQIIYNICDNAVKFSYDGGLYRISIHAIDKKIFVSVYNEGIGISEEDLPYIFERFYKADKSRGVDKTGVGLGMYITRTIIDAHGETIKAESEQGKYCEFTFSLKKDTSKM